jgi:hypothetical protein
MVDYPKNCPFITKGSMLSCPWRNILEDLAVMKQTDPVESDFSVGAIVLIINTIIALVEALIKLLDSIANVLEKIRKQKEGTKTW